MNKEASNDRNYLNKFSNRLLMKFLISVVKAIWQMICILCERLRYIIIKYDRKLARNDFDVVFKLKAPNLKTLVARRKIPKVIKDLRNAIKTVATTIKMIISQGGIVSIAISLKRNHRL